MAVLSIYISDPAFRVLEQVAARTGRTISDLAESAVEDAAIRQKNDDDRLRENVND